MIYFRVGIHRMAPVKPISQSERKLLPAIAGRNSHPRTLLFGPSSVPRPLGPCAGRLMQIATHLLLMQYTN